MKTETDSITVVSRRGFLGGVFSAGALILGSRFIPVDAFAATDGDAATWQPSVYLGLEPDGRVIIIAHRSEMGTGVRTSLPMVVADELEADWARVTIQQAIGDKKYGDQNTDGSNSVRSFYNPMREAGATARAMLESAAASKWGVPASECQAKNHEIVHAKSNRKLGFGELVTLAAQQPVPKKGRPEVQIAQRISLHRKRRAHCGPGCDHRRPRHVRNGRARAGDGLRLYRTVARHRRQAQNL